MASIVLMGAGASYGSGTVDPHTPPLGNDPGGLFSRLEAAGGQASELPDHLTTKFRRNFEKGMAAFDELTNGNIMRFQRELAAYIAQFTPGKGNAYVRLIQTLGIDQIVYSSLNYDLLFELAVESLGLYTVYHTSITAPLVARLLKVHGSCNVWPPAGMFKDVMFEGRVPAVGGFEPDYLTQTQTIYRCEHDDSLAPAIAMFAPGRSVRVLREWVENQQAQWRSAVAVATQIFVVGVRVNAADIHVWAPLAEAKASLTYFGRSSDKNAFCVWKATTRRKNADFVLATFEESIDKMKSRLGG